MRRGAALVAAWSLLLAAPAAAQTPGSAPTLERADPNALVQPPTQDLPPAGHLRSAAVVVAIARRVPKVRAVLGRHPGASHIAYLKGADRWQVSWYAPPAHHDPAAPTAIGPEIAQVIVLDATGRVAEAWTGFQVAWTMARGYPGAFGRRATALYIWIPLCVLFLAPFVDPRRPRRLLHLDLLAVLAFSVSLAFFSHGDIGWSVPLAYPPLAYLLVRTLALGWRRRRPGRDRPEAPLRLLVPASWLAVALVFLVAFRVGLNVVNSNVIDVGYAGVIGADRLADGHGVYGEFPRDNEHGDTYGPFNYEAYVPAEQIAPWSGRWDDVPAAHVAAVAFDLLTILGLWLLGRRVRGPTLGVALAYAWAACPFTLFASSSNSNDALVAALVTFALLAVASPPGRGALAALAGLTKLAPLALAPLLLTYRGGGRAGEAAPRRGRVRTWVGFVLGFAVTGGLALAPVLWHTGLHTLYDRTLGYQADRGSPFSLWGFHTGLGGLQTAVQAAAVALALLVAVLPRRKDVVQVAALAAAVLIALQLGVTHWFYLYVVWFLPPLLVAVLGPFAEPANTAGRASARPWRWSVAWPVRRRASAR